MTDLATWSGYQVSYGDEPHRQGGWLGLVDRPFVKDRPENKGQFPTNAKCLEISFLVNAFSSNLSL